ncbi:hypothetical protein JCM10213_004733 [Rhodosporidiobolus nylandii]
MADCITIRTADDPPVSLVASRVHLVANSKVFADMVSVASSPNQDAVNVAETEKEIQPFLAILAGEGRGKGGMLQKLDEEGWETLARLGDKYDSPIVLQAVEIRYWKLTAQGLAGPLHAFTLASYVGSAEMLQRAAMAAVAVQNRHTHRFGAPQEWKDRLDAWESERSQLAFKLYKEAGRVARMLASSWPNETVHDVYASMLLRSVLDLRMCDKTWDPMAEWKKICDLRAWDGGLSMAKPALTKVASSWAAAPAFPYGE